MGIHGIYKEIGPGQRIALSKLAVDKFEETGRPLRIAIDVSIWLFQIQASKGGTNPALRTFYYRLLRLISLSIHPVFVFDGPNKPPFKRNKRTGPNVASIPEFLAKQLLKQFGFPIHLAPGEAEAECALLQREGIVDAVLSEDVDTLMFGSGLTIRNWSPEQKTGKTPTHVNAYDAVKTKNGPSGLDREGMILIALMSGGDYVPEGIPGCGPKTACEAARAGFGRDLCRITRNDSRAMREWRDRLQHELNTNESKLFNRKRPSMKIPEDFPRLDILGYYTHPAISTRAGLDKLKRSINWNQDLDFSGLRDFTHDAFDWIKLEGAKHFVRSLAPSLLVRHLRMRGERIETLPSDDIQAIEEDESLLVKGIHGKRHHAVTDSTTELRISFTPIDLVKIDLSTEDPDEELEDMPLSLQAPDPNLDEEIPLEIDDDAEIGPKKRGPTKFDPEKAARVWVLETYVRVGVPLKVQDWEAGRLKPLKAKRAATAGDASKATTKPRTSRRAKTTGDVSQASIQSFAKVTKPGVKLSQTLSKLHSTYSGPLATSQPATQRSDTVINLLSSSPVRPDAAPQTAREKSLSPLLEELELPASVTKRRRRAPIQRSRTLPTNLESAAQHPDTNSLDTIETLDLVDPPILPSLSQLLAKTTRTQAKHPPSTRAGRGASVTTSPGKTRQTTLAAWRSPTNTPSKPRETPRASPTPIPAPPTFQATQHGDEMETLDLTLSSPLRPSPPTQQPAPIRPRRNIADVFTARPPLASISSNGSLPSSKSPSLSSRSTRSSEQKLRHTPPPIRRTSPRIRKPKSASPGIESLDLTLISSPAQPSPNPLRRSPRAHKSTSPLPEAHSSLPSPPPPAAWKTQAKKKREIILRKSLAGAWDFVDAESPAKPGVAEAVLKGRERRRWRESEIEVLDLS